MAKGICNVSVAPLRSENSHQSEMVSQLLFGESVDILEKNGSFTKVKMNYDHYEGWVDHKQISDITEETFRDRKTQLVTDPFQVKEIAGQKMLLSIGSELEGKSGHITKQTTPEYVAETARLFLNVPYLWSGRSFFGIDCSGFSQLVYKIHGIALPRDAYQQAEKGTVLDFLEESTSGDLAFFENEDGNIIHVGIMLENQQIIHAYGKVRIDTVDSSGIFNPDLKKHTHKLRFVKRIL